MRKLYIVILACFCLILLSGCGPISMPPVSRYAITSSPPIKKMHHRTHKTLLVSTPIASAGYKSNKMIYITIPYRLRSFANNQWIAPPADMLLPLIAESLRKTDYFKAVVTAPFSGVVNYRLDTQLLTLQQEFLHPVSQIRLVLQATLINDINNHVIASRRFQIVVNAPENNPYGGVLAANRAAASLSKQITQFVLRTLR